jgi:predicted enzyme related to lactoylglutathione lyase
MSERNAYQAGVPCWVETLQPDIDSAKAFYGSVFGWEYAGPGEMPGDPPGQYFVARLRGRDVAGVGSLPPDTPIAWNTCVSVASAERACEEAERAGGSVLVSPFDAPPAGRAAVITDPSGAVLEVWEPGERHGAGLVNEPSAWAMSALRTREADAAAAFYSSVFGWETEPFAGGISLFRLPGYVGGEPLQPVPRDVVAALVPTDEPQAHWAVNFWVDDADAAAARATQAGGSVLARPSDAGGLPQTVLADPAGAAFSVTTAPAPDARA